MRTDVVVFGMRLARIVGNCLVSSCVAMIASIKPAGDASTIELDQAMEVGTVSQRSNTPS